MSGKTVYLRQLATIQILAQMGCFIPAEEGSVCRIANEIFYVGCDNGGGLGVDNCSLFEKELREIFYMLRTKSGIHKSRRHYSVLMIHCPSIWDWTFENICIMRIFIIQFEKGKFFNISKSQVSSSGKSSRFRTFFKSNKTLVCSWMAFYFI